MRASRQLASYALKLPRSVKRGVVLGVDAGLCVLTVWLSSYLRLGECLPLTGSLLLPVLVSVALSIPIFSFLGLYRTVFRYNGLSATVAITKAVLFYAILFAGIFTFYGVQDVPRTIGLIQPLLLLVFVGGSRAGARIWLCGLNYKNLRKTRARQALIYGAGNAGQQLAAALVNSPEINVVGFLDDDGELQEHKLNGLRIYNPADLAEILTDFLISDILLALPSVSHRRRREILSFLKVHKVSVRTLPDLSDIVTGKVYLSDLRDLDINDLLGRDPVIPDRDLLSKNILNKVVLVTGAGGSIGSELCRQILAVGPSKLLLIEQTEFALYAIHQELEAKSMGKKTELLPLLASVQDKNRMRQIMGAWRPDTVYHAAAYKHVPIVEHNATEGIRNNAIGTLHAAQVSAEYGVTNFVLVSTDKAVRPTNIMGASKRLGEMVLQALTPIYPHIRFSMVRFGNVLGSSGSVVPKFRQQIREGGPITLTHTEITRYFMSIPEAAQLVIQAGSMAKGGDVFVLDMGEPVKIIDLARRIVELSGLTVKDEENHDGDIEIRVSGLRPGEKLYEELLIGGNPEPTSHSRIMKAHEDYVPWDALKTALNEIVMAASKNNLHAMYSILSKVVPEYSPSVEIADLVFVGDKTSRLESERTLMVGMAVKNS
ncbi:MAG: polysaccharide biosynthesis protein [Fluviibacter sp.]